MNARERLLQISYDKRLSHIGSCITSLPIIEMVYRIKRPGDKFLLGEGHAGLALYCVLESLGLGNAEEMLEKQGIHPTRLESQGLIDASTGSLGQGLPIAVGMALADRNRNVYVLESDGSMAEGSNWEALRIAEEQKLENLVILVNANGWSGLGATDIDKLERRLKDFDLDITVWRTDPIYPFLQGLVGHYATMTPEQYESTRET
ncbi:MAG: thiamine pyrophosphate-dependent enzyme [Patescibacteria group bacterium]